MSTSRPALPSIALPSGPRLQFLAQGAPDGFPVLLLHGYGDTCRSFGPMLARLPGNVRALAPTQRGHGEGENDATCTLDGMAADAAAFLDAMGSASALVVGHSLGGSVALRLALRHPARVRGLVLVGGFASLRDNPTVPAFRARLESLVDPVDRGFVTSFRASMVASPVDDGLFAMLVEESCKMPADRWRAFFRCMVEEGHRPDDLRRIGAPTLLVWGDRDAYIGRHDQQVLLQALPNARLVVHHGRGHCPHWEDPPAVAAEITAFGEAIGPRDRC